MRYCIIRQTLFSEMFGFGKNHECVCDKVFTNINEALNVKRDLEEHDKQINVSRCLRIVEVRGFVPKKFDLDDMMFLNQTQVVVWTGER